MAINNYKVEGEEEIEQTYHVVYVKLMGNEINGDNIYHLYLSNTPDETFEEGWNEIPACNVNNSLMDLDDDQYQYVVELKSPVVLDLARNCCCFSMQDSKDHIIALAYENLDNVEEYPDIRIIIQYGDRIEDVEEMFAKRDIPLRYVED